MKKIFILLCVFASSVLFPADAKLMQGALCYVYQLQAGQDYPSKNQDAMAVFVDRLTVFYPSKSILSNEETKTFYSSKNLGIKWVGYIKISESGTYTFSLKDSQCANYSDAQKCTVILNDKLILTTDGTKNSNQTPKTSDSKSFKLQAGFYKLIVFRTCASSTNTEVSLVFWNKNFPTKKSVVSPSTMFYAE